LTTSVNDKIAFLHVPKTAGTWATVALAAAGVDLRPVGMHAQLADLPTTERLYRIGFVREPLNWYRSYWAHRHSKQDWRDEPLDTIAHYHFEGFVSRVMDYWPGYLDTLYSSFVGPEGEQIEFVGRYERLADDLVRALQLAGQDFDEEVLRGYPPANVSSKKPVSDLTDTTMQVFLEHHRALYERFYPEVLQEAESVLNGRPGDRQRPPMLRTPQQERYRQHVIAMVGDISPGGYHSPYPSAKDVARATNAWESPPAQLPGIALDPQRQLDLLGELAQFGNGDQFPAKPDPEWRFHHGNLSFPGGDAEVLQAMIRYLQPQRIVAVGSGYGVAAVLDTVDRRLSHEVQCTLVDPNPRELEKPLRPGDAERITLMPSHLQDVDETLFDELGPNDILFIDSSHVSKVGSDVNGLLFNVLPRLAPGVYVHFHDVFYPFEYPSAWILYHRRAWTETYLLRAFLQFNDAFEIVLFSDYLARFHQEAAARSFPSMLTSRPGSLWLRATTEKT
jgi:predicted O-methyltransferase YrrM